jgi:hypothetical protein
MPPASPTVVLPSDVDLLSDLDRIVAISLRKGNARWKNGALASAHLNPIDQL